MFYSGISDEAGVEIDTQIQAHKELGWDHMEIRKVDGGVNITDVSNEQFDDIFRKISEADMKVSCFASQIANHKRPISGDFALDREELQRAIPRMKRLNTQFIRCMSYPNDQDKPLSWEEWKDETLKRLKELVKIAEDNDVVLVHENCSGYGDGPDETLELSHEIDSAHFRLVFDTGNFPSHGNNDSWDFYSKVKDYIVYVHIKDAIRNSEGRKGKAVFPGEGQGYVREIIADLLVSGYSGGFSIEPHLGWLINQRKESGDYKAKYNTYIEYGRKFVEMVKCITDRLAIKAGV